MGKKGFVVVVGGFLGGEGGGVFLLLFCFVFERGLL